MLKSIVSPDRFLLRPFGCSGSKLRPPVRNRPPQCHVSPVSLQHRRSPHCVVIIPEVDVDEYVIALDAEGKAEDRISIILQN